MGGKKNAWAIFEASGRTTPRKPRISRMVKVKFRYCSPTAGVNNELIMHILESYSSMKLY